jgi:hypothetical protein
VEEKLPGRPCFFLEQARACSTGAPIPRPTRVCLVHAYVGVVVGPA